MQHDGNSRQDLVDARDEMRQAVMNAFCGLMQATQLPPMTILEVAAMAVGSVYREVAAAHRGHNTCPCGWRPRDFADIQNLQIALAEGARPHPTVDLLATAAVGRA